MADHEYSQRTITAAAHILAVHPGRLQERLRAAADLLAGTKARAMPDAETLEYHSRVWRALSLYGNTETMLAAMSLTDAQAVADDIFTLDGLLRSCEGEPEAVVRARAPRLTVA